MASEAELLSLLIGEIYDAALNPALWIPTLAKIGGFTGGRGAGLAVKDAVNKTGNVFFNWGVADSYLQSYLETYVKLDPSSTSQYFIEVGQIAVSDDITPREEFVATRFYKEWVEPQGWVDCAVTPLEKSATSMAALFVFRHGLDGPIDDTMLDRIRLIAPHVRRAALVSKTIDLQKAEAAAMADILDGLAAGMFLINASGRIVHANASGHAMLAQGTLLYPIAGKLAATDPDAGQALQDIFALAGKGDAAIGTKGIAIPLRTPDDVSYVAHVLPLTDGSRRQAGIAYSATAAVFVHKASIDMPSPLEIVAKRYKLTPSELRVLHAIVEIGGVAAVAEALGIGEATVKTHLQHLFEKTGTRRQIDLAKLVASHASPLAR